jgi:hypothetical protein
VLFVALLTLVRPAATFQEGGARRLQWQYPEGLNVIAEYWLETDSPRVIAIMEADSMAPLGQMRMDWGAAFYSSTPKRRGRSVRSNWAVSV